jgi:hypothetical protein
MKPTTAKPTIETETDMMAMNIRCRKHQYFCQRADEHLAGHGCPDCPCGLCDGLCKQACVSHPAPVVFLDHMMGLDAPVVN